MENLNENVKHGKKEIKTKEAELKEVMHYPTNVKENLNQKVKIVKNEKFKKDEKIEE